jgi:pantoate--beta-alanine ligase
LWRLIFFFCLLVFQFGNFNDFPGKKQKTKIPVQMITVNTIAELRQHLDGVRQKGPSIGFVPTMGALHQGHVSLLERAKAENQITVCSIFVNPTQFNDPKDLERYPRTPEKDSLLLKEAGCDFLFMPIASEMYPSGYSQPLIQLGSLDEVMEGRKRPGHFKGVVLIVSLLFDAVQPHKAYFGQKDFQQVAVIREMTRQLHYPIQIIACPIMREPGGLAMSSRNVLLSPEERQNAQGISHILVTTKELSASTPLPELIHWAETEITRIPGMELEYFSIADANTLLPVQTLSDATSVVACIAVKLGKVRLIDNILLK